MKKILLSKSKIKEMVGCDLMLFNSINMPNQKVWQSNNQKVFDNLKYELSLQLSDNPTIENAKSIKDLYAHLTESVRFYDEAKERYLWSEQGGADHYHHALNYLTIARKLLTMVK